MLCEFAANQYLNLFYKISVNYFNRCFYTLFVTEFIFASAVAELSAN